MGDERTMLACRLYRPAPIDDRPLRFEECARPEPGAGEVLVRVRACGVCRTDLHVVEGELPPRRTPVIPGHMIVGELASAVPHALRGRPAGSTLAEGDRVGVAWLARTCGRCRYCAGGRENLCPSAEFTGWTRDGGFTQWIVAPAEFVYPLPQSNGLDDESLAPLLCAGIISYRCLRQCSIDDWRGARLGLWGFGAAGHVAIQIATARGADVYVCTRDRERHQSLAADLGAAWVGGTFDRPPVELDAAIIFAPAGEIVPAALKALDRGGTLVLGGIHMSDVPPIPYRLLYHERVLRSVANNTRADGRDFLEEALRARIRTSTTLFPLAEANEALLALKHDAIRGAAVLTIP